MPDWHERITDDTRPSIRAEHELRYALAAPLIAAAARWCDLGCGTGLAAAAALEQPYEGTALLVDREQQLADRAAAALDARQTVALAADLATADGIAAVRDALAAGEGPLVVTCLETLAQLTDFAPLVALLTELAAQPGCTVVLSVPNDDYWALENPHAATAWGAGAVAELRTLLPDGHVVLHQVALQGSAIAPAEASADAQAAVALAPGVPSHLLLAFGAAAAQLGATGPATRVVQSDVEAQRRWERQRESDLLYYATAASALERRLAAVATPPAPAPAAPAPGGDGDDASDAPAASGHA